MSKLPATHSKFRFIELGLALILLVSLASTNSYSQIDRSNEILPFDDVFVLDVNLVNGSLIARWSIQERHYLYQRAIDILADGKSILIKKNLPAATKKNDLTFGNVDVYYDQLELVIPVGKLKKNTLFSITAQGCREEEFCYVPRTRTYVFNGSNLTEKVLDP